MTTIVPHPSTYSGLPYLTDIITDSVEFTTVVDYAIKGIIHYYALELMTVSDASTFLTLVEDYQATKVRQWPLSVYLSFNGYANQFECAYKMEKLDTITKVIGPVPTNWFNTIKVDWKRLDLTTNLITKSKHRRSKAEIEKEQKLKKERAAKRAAKSEASK